MSSSSASSSRESSAEPAAARGATVAGSGRNEGVNPHWKLQPPAGAELAGRDANFGALDWDAVCDDDDVELWLVRAPSGLDPKDILATQLGPLPAPTAARPQRVGAVKHTDAAYDVWALGAGVRDDEDTDGAPPTAAGDEMRGLTCLLPRAQKGGKLYASTKPFTRRLVLSAQPARPSPADADTAGAPAAPLTQNPPRPAYEPGAFVHAFVPAGAAAPFPQRGGAAYASRGAMDVDPDTDAAVAPAAVAGESPRKKAKKVRVAPVEVEAEAPPSAVEGAEANRKEKKKKDKSSDAAAASNVEERAGKKRKGEGKEDAPAQKKVKKAKVET